MNYWSIIIFSQRKNIYSNQWWRKYFVYFLSLAVKVSLYRSKKYMETLGQGYVILTRFCSTAQWGDVHITCFRNQRISYKPMWRAVRPIAWPYGHAVSCDNYLSEYQMWVGSKHRSTWPNVRVAVIIFACASIELNAETRIVVSWRYRLCISYLYSAFYVFW